MAKKWEPDPSVRPLLAAIAKAEKQRDTMSRNERLGRDRETGRAEMFPSTQPGDRQWRSPLGGLATETKG
jgi:hypothetical protein